MRLGRAHTPLRCLPALSQVRLHGATLLDEALFVEALSRAAIYMLSRHPLDLLYPTDGDKVEAVFRRCARRMKGVTGRGRPQPISAPPLQNRPHEPAPPRRAAALA